MIQRIYMMTLTASCEKYAIIPPIIKAASNTRIIHILILIPFPPMLQAFEYIAIETSKRVQKIMRIKRPH
jgi:hypothetical protein